MKIKVTCYLMFLNKDNAIELNAYEKIIETEFILPIIPVTGMYIEIEDRLRPQLKELGLERYKFKMEYLITKVTILGNSVELEIDDIKKESNEKGYVEKEQLDLEIEDFVKCVFTNGNQKKCLTIGKFYQVYLAGNTYNNNRYFSITDDNGKHKQYTSPCINFKAYSYK